YDDHGGYEHPDHVQVYTVGVRAAEIAGTPRVYEATANRDYIQSLLSSNRELLPEDAPDAPDAASMETFGTPAAEITTTVDVRDFTDRKREAMAAHSSQIPDDSFFLQLPPEAFREAFGYEWFIRRDKRDAQENWIFEDL